MPANALLYQRKPQPSPDPAVLAEALYQDANKQRAAGQLDAAIAAYDAALKLKPAFPEALRAGGTLLRDRGFIDGALTFLAEAVRLKPGYLDAVLDYGNLLYALQRFEAALATFEAALAHRPGDAGLLTNRGIALHGLGRLAEAQASLETAIAADPRMPQAHLNYGNVLARQGDHPRSLPAFDRAIALKPVYPSAHNGRGLALVALGRFEEGDAAFATTLAQDPGNAYALTNRGKLRLLRGDFAGGLPDYESRLATEWQTLPALKQVIPTWSGQALAGLRIVTFADQGAGDVIHFVRYVPMLVAAGADVTVVCRPRMTRLLRDVMAGARVVEAIGDDESFDLQIPFGSLLHVFGTRLETIPAPAPYLAAEPDRIAAWAARLGSPNATDGFRIGICWRGNQDWRADPHRSVPVELLAPLAAIPRVRLISLQVGEGPVAPEFPLERYADADSGDHAFVDTAAIMANLDLVVSCDTSICHLAGALACPTYALLPHVPEWRWLLGRDDTPWYPTMRLFRQPARGDWVAAINSLVDAVAARVRD